MTHEALGDKALWTYYSSSTGGVTENVEDVFGGNPQPYLKSVDDHWGADPSINGLAVWERVLPEATLRAKLCEEGYCWDQVTGSKVISQPPAATIRFAGLLGGELQSADMPAVWLYHVLGRLGYKVSPYITKVMAPSPFVDIGDSVHFDNINYIADKGITKGCNPPDNTLFCPTIP